jgi:hypothetical protein
VLANGSWDVRVPPGLVALFPWAVRRGYWYKVTRDQARQVVALLATAYGVVAPAIAETSPKGANGWYRPRIQTIYVWPRGHLKTVFHEFYHHLDHLTGGVYCSDDYPEAHRWAKLGEPTPPRSLAWVYADKLWEALKAATPRTGG